MRTCRLDSVSGSDRVECDRVHIHIEFFRRQERDDLIEEDLRDGNALAQRHFEAVLEFTLVRITWDHGAFSAQILSW